MTDASAAAAAAADGPPGPTETLSGLRILYVTHRFPFPPNDGARVRAWNAIRYFSRNNEVTVAAPLRGGESDSLLAELRHHCAHIITARISDWAARSRLAASLLSPKSASEAYFYSPALARAIRQSWQRSPYDLIMVHCSAVAPYVIDAPAPKILDFVDMDSQKWTEYAAVKRWPLSLGYRLEGWKLRRLERICAHRFDGCAAATAAELEILDALSPSARTMFFSNGVDLSYFRPSDTGYDPNLICFVGRMSYYPNIRAAEYFVNDVFPLIRRRRPEARFVIVGADPTAAVRALADRAGVEVTGSVPDVRPFLQNAALSVTPLEIARGTQNKILESMAAGVPVVTSPNVLKGVNAHAGEHLLVADGAAAFADSVCRILEDPDERARLSRAGRARVESRHDWTGELAQFDRFAAAILAGAQGARSHREPR